MPFGAGHVMLALREDKLLGDGNQSNVLSDCRIDGHKMNVVCQGRIGRTHIDHRTEAQVIAKGTIRWTNGQKNDTTGRV